METSRPVSLSDELLTMARADQDARDPSLPEKTQMDNPVDAINTARLTAIVDEHGWPTISNVGPEASHAAWLIAQHTPDFDFMQRCYQLMESAEPGDVSPADKAYLLDRILVIQGEPQIYGTQFHGRGEEFAAFPIDQPETVDERRASVGLSSFAENMQAIRKYYRI